MQQPLARLRGLTFAPGTNRRGEASGAAWTFALPSQQLGIVVCLGSPSTAGLSRLSLLAERVVIAADGSGAGNSRTIAERAGWPNVEVLTAEEAARESTEAPADLVWLAAAGRGLSRLIREPATGAVLRSAALVYREKRSLGRPPAGTRSGTGHPAESVLTLRLTPAAGEARSAVPLDDRATSRYFAANDLEEQWLRREVQRRGLPYSAAVGRRLAGWTPRRLVTRTGLLRSRDTNLFRGPPRYLRESAAGEGLQLDGYRWGMSAKGQYASQKALVFLFANDEPTPRILVKVTAEPSRSHLLENAYRGLRRLQDSGFGRAGRAPRALFTGAAGGLRLVGEEAVQGRPFGRLSTGEPDCRYAGEAVAAITELGTTVAGIYPLAQLPASLAPLTDQFFSVYRPSAELRGHLEAQLAALAASAGDLPLVFMHGDPGIQNILVRPDGLVVLLDWENAEPAGLPLWDLFHFLQTYAVWASRRRGLSSRAAALRRHFLEGSTLTKFIARSVEGYCRTVAVEPAAVGPLFWLHMLVQAVREAPRLDPARVQQGHFLELLEVFAARRNGEVLRRILQVEA